MKAYQHRPRAKTGAAYKSHHSKRERFGNTLAGCTPRCSGVAHAPCSGRRCLLVAARGRWRRPPTASRLLNSESARGTSASGRVSLLVSRKREHTQSPCHSSRAGRTTPSLRHPRKLESTAQHLAGCVEPHTELCANTLSIIAAAAVRRGGEQRLARARAVSHSPLTARRVTAWHGCREPGAAADTWLTVHGVRGRRITQEEGTASDTRQQLPIPRGHAVRIAPPRAPSDGAQILVVYTRFR